ncbi:integral membrane protein [Penicillium frequentans]|uniref:Integral membrane protein n=1 Tax=Penicillium frequentans TaxID=3151616 RepID=A0AAD6D7C7_9EURO|nr:integral membrane protein [Penicillium glabrum]
MMTGYMDAGAAAMATVSHINSNGRMSYFTYGKHSDTIMAHMALMMLGWCLILPAAVVLSITRSRLALLSQFIFLLFNTLGLLLGIVYNSQTPDLYKNNAHHKIGWIGTWVIGAHVILALIFTYFGRGESQSMYKSVFNHTTGAMHDYCSPKDNCQSNESNSPSHGFESSFCGSITEYSGLEKNKEEPLEQLAAPRVWFRNTLVDQFLYTRIPGMVNCVLRISNVVYNVIDRTILPFGFIAIATGAVTYGGIMRDCNVLDRLVQCVKDGILFWYAMPMPGCFLNFWEDLGRA